MNRIWLSLGMCALAALLAGCPQQDEQPAVVIDDAGGDGTVAVVIDSETDAAAADAEARDSPASAPRTVAASEPQPPSESELRGRWFALYGRTNSGQQTYTYEDGHLLEFLEAGGLSFVIRKDGSDRSRIGGQWNLAGSNVRISMADRTSAKTGEFGATTPLGFGRDSEIGLDRAGRDSEIGLERAGRDSEIGLENKTMSGEAETQTAMVLGLEALHDDNFLVLTGRNGEIFVYGRVDNPHANSAPELAEGSWRGEIAAGQLADAQIELDGNTLVATYGGDNSRFTGQYTRGYYVGAVISTSGTAIAAVAPVGSGQLNGVIAPAPFREVRHEFDFVHQP